jgi:hypothetical protein
MSSLKNSFIASISLLALIGMIALMTPRTGQSQTEAVGPPKPVLVINSPSEPVPVTGMVNVGNLGNSPLPVRDVDNGRQPFQETTTISLVGDSGHSTTIFTVPAGKRFIIETVSAHAELAPVDTPHRIEVITQLGNKTVFHRILVSRQGMDLNGQNVFVGTHYIRAYADPGTDVEFEFSHSNAANNASASITISGYFIDLP